MKTRTIGLFLMIAAIGTMGFQIGATAKYQDNRYAFMLPVGIAFLLVGLFLFFREVAREKREQE